MGRAPIVVSWIVLVTAWLACSSPESFRAGRGGLSTGVAGAGGEPGLAGSLGTDAGALAGDSGAAGAAGAGGGGAGDSGSLAGISGAAGATTAGAAGAAGMGTAGAGGAAGSGGAGAGVAGAGATAGSTAGTGGSAGAPSTGTAGAAPTGPLTLPMTVSDHFRPTGGMGDAVVTGAVTIGTDATACAGEPAAANKGSCYTMTYHPQPIVAPATSTWAGFYWQYPDNNWGAAQPLTIASGAKDISFYAKGMAGGEAVTFQAGGIVNTVGPTTPFTDAFTVRMTFTLTTSWTKYTLPMTGQTYGGVLGAFGWVAAVPSTNPLTFLVTGVVWE